MDAVSENAADVFAAAATGVVVAAAGLAGAYLLVRGAPRRALVASLGLGVVGHGLLAGLADGDDIHAVHFFARNVEADAALVEMRFRR